MSIGQIRLISIFKLKDAIAESKKCILLCANCHRELHDNLWSIEELK